MSHLYKFVPHEWLRVKFTDIKIFVLKFREKTPDRLSAFSRFLGSVDIGSWRVYARTLYDSRKYKIFGQAGSFFYFYLFFLFINFQKSLAGMGRQGSAMNDACFMSQEDVVKIVCSTCHGGPQKEVEHNGVHVCR